MADTSTTSSGAAPQSKSVSPTVFWIVAVVLAIAIGVVYFLLNKDVTETRENINSAMKTAVADQDKKRDEAIAATTKAFNAELAKQQEKIGKLEGGLEKTTGDLAKLSAAHDGTIAKVDTLKKEAMAKIAETASGLSQTNTNVQKVEVEVKYMKDNIAKINEKLAAVDKEIANLGTGQTALKEELLCNLKLRNFLCPRRGEGCSRPTRCWSKTP